MKACGSRFVFPIFVGFAVLFAAAIAGLASRVAAGQMGGMRGMPGANLPTGGPNPTPAEQAAYKAFNDENNPEAKIRLGEDFDENYPQSRYEESVDESLTFLYFNKQAWPSFYAKADRVIAINPKSTLVLELVGWVVARNYKSTDPNAAQELDKAESYEKTALGIIASMKKPKQVTQAQFDDSQTSLAWRAHSGLGAVYFWRKDYADSAKEMQAALKQEASEPDPGDLYLLGVDFENLNRASDATDAFSLCSQITGDMAETCRKAYEAAAHELVESKEEADFNAFNRATNDDTKIQLGEAFEQKYPQSTYAEQVDSALVLVYDRKQAWDKFYAAADRALARDPDVVPVLAYVGWVIPHLYDTDQAGGAEKLDEAEKYEKHALELIPTMQKPAQLTEEDFAQAKLTETSQAHGGLGLIYYRRQNYEDAVKELQIATAGPGDADPSNLYVLGVVLGKLNRNADAVEAFTRCGEIDSALKQQCRRDADAVKQQAANTASPTTATLTQPSADKAAQTLTASNATAPLRAAAVDIPPASAQPIAAPLRTETIVVPVRVVVRDTNGRLVKNLKKDDFELYQDGKEQTIASFNMVSNAPPAPTPGQRDESDTSGTGAASSNPILPASSSAAASDELRKGENQYDEAAVAPSRFIALFFDDVHLYFVNLAQTRDAATQYLDSLPPTDRVAIVTASGENQTEFSGDRKRLHDAVMKLQPHPFPGGPGAATSSLPCPAPMSYTEADAIVDQDSDRVLAVASEDVAECHHMPEAFDGEGAAHALAIETHVAGEEAVDSVFERLRATVRRLSALPGERVIVVVSPGFVYGGHEQTFADVTNFAIRSNVVVNTLDANGVYGGGPRDRNGLPVDKWDPDRFMKFGFGHDTELAVLSDLALSTGGIAIRGNNDFKGAIRGLSSAPESYYLLGYSPQGLTADGKFHVLKVSLTRGSKDRIEARRGFYAPSQTETADAASKREIQDAIFSRDEQRDLPVKFETNLSVEAAGGHKLAVKASVDVTHLDFQKKGDANTEDLTVAAALFDRDGNYVAGTQKVDQMNLSDATLEQLAKNGFYIELDIDAKPGEYQARFVARDSNDGHIAAENVAVSVKN